MPSNNDGSSKKDGADADGKGHTLQPVLIIPGFMSSGLEVKSSSTRPSWIGERIWINLQSLGFESIYFGDATKRGEKHDVDDDENDAGDDDENGGEPSAGQKQHRQFKSAWLQHMILNNDMKTEKYGVELRAISGLEGVDYLSPGALTNHVSYVFGPVIEALKKEGYSETKNLQAAPYDWRLPPMELEKRDNYFSNTMKQVEELCKANDNLPVVLLCHSLGTKTCHYFLNFCLMKKGQNWIDKHIHTYMPVGGPHLGAPKALRSVITGDKMGLDTFLSDEEALSMGRSLGSGPWLFPTKLPQNVPSCVYFRPQGVLEITILNPINTTTLVQKRTTLTKPNRYQLRVSLLGDKQKRHVSTPFCRADSNNVVNFIDQKIYFATSQHPIRDTQKERLIQISLFEPGISVAKKEADERKCNPLICILKCISGVWICDLAYRILRFFSCILVQGLALSADFVTSAAGTASTLAISDKHFLGHQVFSGKPITVNINVKHKDDIDRYEGGCCCCCCCYCCQTLVQPRSTNVKLQIKWIPYEEIDPNSRVCSSIADPTSKPAMTTRSGDEEEGGVGRTSEPPTTTAESKNNNVTSRLTIRRKEEIYQEFSGYDIIHREGLGSVLSVVKDVYDEDHIELGPRTKSSFDVPPVRRVHAIYGINLPTEVGAIYKRKDTCLSDGQLKNLYRLDAFAELAPDSRKEGYITKNGILLETKQTKQPMEENRAVSGDGTVPYWSLQHVKTWQGPSCDVSVVELDKAEHREILADSRFHKALVAYCKDNPNPRPLVSSASDDVEQQQGTVTTIIDSLKTCL